MSTSNGKRAALRLSLVLGVSVVAVSCSGIRGSGTFPGTLDEGVRVTLPQLARYVEGKSGGLIRCTISDTTRPYLYFTWDPYNKQHIVAPDRVSYGEAQGLFRLDEELLVRDEGAIDFLAAVRTRTSRMPLDTVRTMPIRPYRCLAAWGSLFYPPIRHLSQPMEFYHSPFTPSFDPDTVESQYFDPSFQVSLDRETDTELTYGNTLRALFNGVESYPEKLRLSRGARRFLYVAVMTFVADETGRELIRVMVDRKRAGVDVRLITDDFYTFSISNYAIGVLEREGIPVARVADKRLNQLDRMFHNKIWIRDGEEAILGGMNVLDYENEADGFNFMNRDTDILIRGPAVTGLLDRFIALWKRYDRENRPIDSAEALARQRRAEEHALGVRGQENYARWLGSPATRMNGICRTAVQGDGAEPQNIVRLLTRYVEASRTGFYLTSPEIEYEPERSPPASIDILARAMARKLAQPGYTLAYVTNGTDGGLGESSIFLNSRLHDAQLAGEPLWLDLLAPILAQSGREVNARVRRTIRPLVQAGADGYQYFNYMHAKQFYWDRLLVGIGSWNFDGYSADNNHESAVFCLDRALRDQMERQMVLDMINSVPIIVHDDHP